MFNKAKTNLQSSYHYLSVPSPTKELFFWGQHIHHLHSLAIPAFKNGRWHLSLPTYLHSLPLAKKSRQYRAPEVILSMGCLVSSNALVMKITGGWGGSVKLLRNPHPDLSPKLRLEWTLGFVVYGMYRYGALHRGVAVAWWIEKTDRLNMYYLGTAKILVHSEYCTESIHFHEGNPVNLHDFHCEPVFRHGLDAWLLKGWVKWRALVRSFRRWL